MSDLVVLGVYFHCCFRAVWVILHCCFFDNKVDERICRICGFPLFFSMFWSPLVFCKALLCPLVLGITMAWPRWGIQEVQSKLILSTTVSGMPKKCDMAFHINRKQAL